MDNIFGLPMATVAVVVAGLMGACLIVSILIALRNRIIFKMVMRNIPRRKAQTILISLGLMLSTLIVAASLTTGDTLNYSVTKSTYDNLGRVDETIAYVGNRSSKGDVSVDNQPIADSVATELSQRLAGNRNIAAVMPVLTFGVPVVDTATRLNESQVVLTGLDASKLDAFGGLKTASGTSIDFSSLPAGSSVISQTLDDELDAQIGDRLTFSFNNQPETLTVGGIASDSILTGYGANTSGSGPAAATTPSMLGVAVPLGWLQQITGFQGKARFIAVANRGGVQTSESQTDAAVTSLQSALSHIDGGSTLGVNPIKQDAVNRAESIASLFTTFFIVMGLFSIVSGILLIFVIFTMLASERRAEMGMARAVGMTRSQLIQGFITEGTGYDLGAALIGAAIGVLVSLAMVRVLGTLVGGSLAIEPHVTLRSLFVAYALGVSVTFLTIVFAAVRASRVNIVAAIRDLPDQAHVGNVEPIRWRWWSRLPRFGSHFGSALVAIICAPLEFIWNVVLVAPKLLVWGSHRLAQTIGWGPVISLVGAFSVALGVSAKNVYAFATGLSILVLGLSLFGRRYLPSRLVFSVGAGLMLAYWLLPSSVSGRVLPNVGTGGPAMFFLSGIFMVLYMTLIIMWNADLILWFVSLFGRMFARWLPAIKTAVAYPLASRGRTGMTVAMFSIVVFSLVMVKTINVNFLELLLSNEATAGWDVKVTTNSANPISDLRTRLAGTDVDLSNVDAGGKISTITPSASMIRNAGGTNWARDTINGMDNDFINNSK
ncbi:MAG TPA: FtsX-like permease family protein, partial [Nitrolancea sp.]|nr:FtsX-like permease family protein [Nitrolancea sp.]